MDFIIGSIVGIFVVGVLRHYQLPTWLIITGCIAAVFTVRGILYKLN